MINIIQIDVDSLEIAASQLSEKELGEEGLVS